MTLTARELAVLKTPLGPRYDDRLERFVANLRGFGIQGRGPVSGGRGINAGSDIPDSVVDSFEDGDTAEWSGESSFQTTTNSIFGTYAAKITNSADGPVAYTLPGDGLNYYPEHGAQIEYYLKNIAGDGSNNETAHFFFGVGQSDGTQGGTSGYDLTINTKNSINFLKSNADGTSSPLFSASQSIDSRTYRIEIDWLDQKTIRLYDYSNGNSLLLEQSATDTTYDDNRGIAYGRQAAETGAIIDEIRSNGSV